MYVGAMTNADLPSDTAKAPEKARKAALKALLDGWGAAGASMTRLASGLGALQYALFVGFAWGAASAVSALVNSQPIWPGLTLALACATLRAAAQAGETRAGLEASARVRAGVRRASKRVRGSFM